MCELRGVMSPNDPMYEAIGARAAGNFFSAPARINMSSKMVLALAEGFARACADRRIVYGFRMMAEAIARQRLR